MKRYIVLISLFLFFYNLIRNAETTEIKDRPKIEDIYHNFSGGVATGLNIPFFVYSDPHFIDVDSQVFLEFIFKFDYLFSIKINDKYRIGFSLSIGDSVSFAPLPPYYLTFYFGSYYFFCNRVQQKVTLVNMFGNDFIKKYLLLEVGETISLTNFIGQKPFYNGYELTNEVMYYTTFFMAPYLFIGYQAYLSIKKTTNIIGGFIEFNFDIGKHILPNQSYMQDILIYFGFGIEYRIGYTIKHKIK